MYVQISQCQRQGFWRQMRDIITIQAGQCGNQSKIYGSDYYC